MKTVVIVPTYNEVSNIKLVIDEILNCGTSADILIVDDMSPDETYKIVEEISKTNNKVHLLLRNERKGRGYAGKAGFLKALDMKADYIIEMDGDGSHSPKYIPEFLKTIKNCDVVIGSRYINGGKDEERSIVRQIVSNFSRWYLSFILGVKIQDPTSGYRMFKKEALTKFAAELTANDPFIVTEVLYKIKKNNLKVKEYPIIFLARFSGKSKLRLGALIMYLFKVLKLKLTGK
ncbi:MAG: polyprenol monophosphomannose synthase [Endomicrobium sp.]|jgi:dolichol-phosphate mannosyltransferase|nr:polyprenol monophosphomannose synthase [Endomicrobium sp.]